MYGSIDCTSERTLWWESITKFGMVRCYGVVKQGVVQMWCGMVWVGIVLNGYGSDVYSLLGASITKFGTAPLKHHSVYLMLAMMMMMLVVSLISMKRLLHPLPSL